MAQVEQAQGHCNKCGSTDGHMSPACKKNIKKSKWWINKFRTGQVNIQVGKNTNNKINQMMMMTKKKSNGGSNTVNY